MTAAKTRKSLHIFVACGLRPNVGEILWPSSSPEEERRLSFDLDGDGEKDTLVGKRWERWGRINFRVHFGDGLTSSGELPASKRVGVIAEKTNRYHDLVCDFDQRIRWSGKRYEADLSTP